MVDAPVPGLERAMQADRGGYVAGKPDPELIGHERERIECRPGHPRMDLEEVVAHRLLGAHHPGSGVWCRRALAAERRARRPDPGRQDLTTRGTVAEPQMPGMAEHAANRGHAVHRIELEHPGNLRVGHLSARRNVGVHLRQSRNEEFARGIDAGCPFGHTDPAGGTDLGDASIAHDHGLARDRAFSIHRDDGDVDERDRLIRLGLGCRWLDAD
jgi:hypothetical protein